MSPDEWVDLQAAKDGRRTFRKWIRMCRYSHERGYTVGAPMIHFYRLHGHWPKMAWSRIGRELFRRLDERKNG